MSTEKNETLGPFPFTGPARGVAEENQAAHGGVCFVDVRPDGMRRERNVNNGSEEVGGWYQPQHRR